MQQQVSHRHKRKPYHRDDPDWRPWEPGKGGMPKAEWVPEWKERMTMKGFREYAA